MSDKCDKCEQPLDHNHGASLCGMGKYRPPLEEAQVPDPEQLSTEQLGSPPVATSDIIQSLVNVRDERQKIAARDKELIDKWRSLELELLIRLDEQGMLKATTGAGTASITKTVLPQVTDWDAVFKHIQETGDFYLLQKRPAAAAFRELNNSGITIPGIEPYTKRAISLRKT